MGDLACFYGKILAFLGIGFGVIIFVSLFCCFLYFLIGFGSGFDVFMVWREREAVGFKKSPEEIFFIMRQQCARCHLGGWIVARS